MTKRLPLHRLAALSLCVAAAFAFCGRAYADTPLTAEEIIRRLVERSEVSESREAQTNYSFRKLTISEGLDSKGRVTERKEKLYDVLVEAGLQKLTLVQIDGKTPPPKELKKQAERDAAERAKYSPDAKPAKKKQPNKHGDNLATAELTARYRFTRLPDESINNRPVFVLAFEPKSGKLPEKELTDRFLNQMAGKIWIDVEEFELARADVHLRSEITLWGGVLAKLRRCEFSFTRLRVPEGFWIESASSGLFEGRKLFDSVTIKFSSEATGYRPSAAVPKP